MAYSNTYARVMEIEQIQIELHEASIYIEYADPTEDDEDFGFPNAMHKALEAAPEGLEQSVAEAEALDFVGRLLDYADPNYLDDVRVEVEGEYVPRSLHLPLHGLKVEDTFDKHSIPCNLTDPLTGVVAHLEFQMVPHDGGGPRVFSFAADDGVLSSEGIRNHVIKTTGISDVAGHWLAGPDFQEESVKGRCLPFETNLVIVPTNKEARAMQETVEEGGTADNASIKVFADRTYRLALRRKLGYVSVPVGLPAKLPRKVIGTVFGIKRWIIHNVPSASHLDVGSIQVRMES